MFRRCREQVICQNKKNTTYLRKPCLAGETRFAFQRSLARRVRQNIQAVRPIACNAYAQHTCVSRARAPPCQNKKNTTYLRKPCLAGETRFAFQRSLARRARQNVQAVRPIACNAYAQHTCVSRARAPPCQNKKNTTYLRKPCLAGETRFAFQRSLARRARQNVQAVRPIACNAYAQHTCVSRARAQPCQNKKTRLTYASRVWQGRRDSNTQPMVLETTTLPLSHSPKSIVII